MRLACLISALLTATAAHADPGHLTNVAGHDHWLAAGALGAAVVILLVAALKGRKREEGPDAEAAEDEGARTQEN